jgi:hypothetical protein
MLKSLLFSLLVAMATPLSAMNNSTKITEKCFQELQKIRADGGILYWYLNGVWLGAAEKKLQDKPSAILSFLAKPTSNINKATDLRHMPATSYIKKVISNYYSELDNKFLELYTNKKNYDQAWKQFDMHLKNEGMSKMLGEYQQQLVDEDQKNIE